MRGIKGKTVVRGVESFENAAGAGTYILVNNAGWDAPMPFLKTSEEFWKKVVAINYLGPLQVTHAVAKGMAARIGGPDDYAGLAAFLASDDAVFMTGQTISVSGGLTMHG